MLFHLVKSRIITVVERHAFGEYESLPGEFGPSCGKYRFTYHAYCLWEEKRIGEDVHIFSNLY